MRISDVGSTLHEYLRVERRIDSVTAGGRPAYAYEPLANRTCINLWGGLFVNKPAVSKKFNFMCDRQHRFELGHFLHDGDLTDDDFTVAHIIVRTQTGGLWTMGTLDINSGEIVMIWPEDPGPDHYLTVSYRFGTVIPTARQSLSFSWREEGF